MPRPGSGQGSSSRSSSSHSYSSRNTSTHRISQSAKARPGSAYRGSNGYEDLADNRLRKNPYPSSRDSMGSYRTNLRGNNWNPLLRSGIFRRNSYSNYPPNDLYGNPYSRRRSSSGTIVTLVVFFIILFLVFSMFGCAKNNDDIDYSSYNREKLQSSTSYNANCIVDEESFFENPSQTGKRLKTFYDKTGVQPYIVIQSYDPSLKTDAQKEEYAKEYYDEYINNEDTFLYMYFADKDPNEVGSMTTVNGNNIDSVMDQQAVNIFWDVLDSQWTSAQSTDDMFVNVFDKTADRIMSKSTTANDVNKTMLIVAGVLIAGGIIILLIVLKRKHEAQRAAETERILNAPLTPDDSSDNDDLLHKYGG